MVGLVLIKVEVVARPLGHPALAIHRRYPATAPRGSFWLLGFPPRPVHPSLDDLAVTVLRHGRHIDAVLGVDARSTCARAVWNSQRRRLPPPGLHVAGLQAHATTPSRSSSDLNNPPQPPFPITLLPTLLSSPPISYPYLHPH
ncbi:unnamed protein product [Hydatigera taeniaeformis]|uniref:Uncharacterized protein n=1 Tax=Hydatigena taeniaeformis TaxID=6205 RepID=A0A0R3WQU0_HYDTA|nr:unnamed protein product [Hydatigera taeniaeformis]